MIPMGHPVIYTSLTDATLGQVQLCGQLFVIYAMQNQRKPDDQTAKGNLNDPISENIAANKRLHGNLMT